MKLLDNIRDGVRRVMRAIAGILNTTTGGKLSPNAVTVVGLLAHIPIAWLIATGRNDIAAGILLIIFGLFDALDGELARIQKRPSHAGMFLDSVTDRIKEIMLYMGIVVNIYYAATPPPGCGWIEGCSYTLKGPDVGINYILAFIIAVLGGSMLTSYINAWGEAVMSRAGASSSAMNKVFRGGLASFEVRIALIALGLLTGMLFGALLLIGLLVGLTTIIRMYKVFRELSRVQN